jgi:dihydroorotate dehydrogenase (NAD+) catalytic subunit
MLADETAGGPRRIRPEPSVSRPGVVRGATESAGLPRACAIMLAMPTVKPAASGSRREASPGAPALSLEFCGLNFSSPIVLLSGCVGFGEEYTRIEGFSNRDAGAIVLKGTTGKPRLGNPPHRVYETPAGMLNAIGLQNPGVDRVVREILPGLDFTETRFIANACGSTIEEYVEVTRRFDESPIDAIEINISCPNVKEGGVAFGNYPDMSAQVIAACRRVTKKPLIAKLSPNQTDIRENARRCIEAGADALAVINTIMGMAIEVGTRRPVIGNVQGGLSGPAIKPIALLKVHQVYEVARAHSVPIIGQGGIVSATDALEFLIAGATAVGVGTALFYDPMVLKRINEGIAEYLRAQGLANVGELVGTLATRSDTLDCAVSG